MQSGFGSDDTGDSYFVRFYGPGHPSGDQPVRVKTQRLRPFCIGDPSGQGSYPDEQLEHGVENGARRAAIRCAQTAFEEKTEMLKRVLGKRSRGSELSCTIDVGDRLEAAHEGNEDNTHVQLSLDDESAVSSSSNEDQNEVALPQRQRREDTPKKSDSKNPLHLQMQDRLRAVFASIGKIPRKKVSHDSTFGCDASEMGVSGSAQVGVSAQNGRSIASPSKTAYAAPHKETFPFNSAQQRRVSSNQEATRRKSESSTVYCNQCGFWGHRSKDCTALGQAGASVVDTHAHANLHGDASVACLANSGNSDRPAKTNFRHRVDSRDHSRGSSRGRLGSSFRNSSGAFYRGYSHRPTPLRQRSRSLDSRVDALRADVLVQLGQQRRVGAGVLSRYMDKLASQRTGVLGDMERGYR